MRLELTWALKLTQILAHELPHYYDCFLESRLRNYLSQPITQHCLSFRDNPVQQYVTRGYIVNQADNLTKSPNLVVKLQ